MFAGFMAANLYMSMFLCMCGTRSSESDSLRRVWYSTPLSSGRDGILKSVQQCVC